MHSYIYDKMPARIVGCTESQQTNFSGPDTTLQLYLWEEDYDYLVMRILPKRTESNSYETSTIYNNNVPYQGIFPLYQIVPKNASSFVVTGIVRTDEANNNSDLVLTNCGKISIDENNIITIAGTVMSSMSENIISFTAYKNNI